MTDATTLELRETLESNRLFNDKAIYAKGSSTADFNANLTSEKPQNHSQTEGAPNPSNSSSNVPQESRPTKTGVPKELQQNASGVQKTPSGGRQPSKWYAGFEYKWDSDFTFLGKTGAYVCYRIIDARGTVVPMVLLQNKENKPYGKIDYPEISANQMKSRQNNVEHELQQCESQVPQQTQSSQSMREQIDPDAPTPGIVEILGKIKAAGPESYAKVGGIYDLESGWLTWNQSPNEFSTAKSKWVANSMLEGFSHLAKTMARLRLEGRSTEEITNLMRRAAANVTEILRTAHGAEGGYEALRQFNDVFGVKFEEMTTATQVRNAVAMRINDLGRMNARELIQNADVWHSTFLANRNAMQNPWRLEERAVANKEIKADDIFVNLSETFGDKHYQKLIDAIVNGNSLAKDASLASIKLTMEQALYSSNIRETGDKKEFLSTEVTIDYINDDLRRLFTLEQEESALLFIASAEVKETQAYRDRLDAIRFGKEAAKQKLAKSIKTAVVAWRERVGRVEDASFGRNLQDL